MSRCARFLLPPCAYVTRREVQRKPPTPRNHQRIADCRSSDRSRDRLGREDPGRRDGNMTLDQTCRGIRERNNVGRIAFRALRRDLPNRMLKVELGPVRLGYLGGSLRRQHLESQQCGDWRRNERRQLMPDYPQLGG